MPYWLIHDFASARSLAEDIVVSEWVKFLEILYEVSRAIGRAGFGGLQREYRVLVKGISDRGMLTVECPEFGLCFRPRRVVEYPVLFSLTIERGLMVDFFRYPDSKCGRWILYICFLICLYSS